MLDVRGDTKTLSQGQRGLENDKINGLPKRVVNRRWTASSMPSITDEMSGIPDVQQPMHSKTRNEYLLSHQMTADSPRKELLSSSGIHTSEGPGNGVHVQSDSGINNKGHSKSNIKHKRKLTKLSVRLQEQSTTQYLLVRKPKAPDKHVQCVDDRYDAKVRNAPQPMERDCAGQPINQ
jgi:hypothetical protein